MHKVLTGVSQFSPYKESTDLTFETPMILEKSNKPTLFFLSLFVEYSKAFLCPMSIPVNHRSVDMQEILRVKDGKNLLQALSSTQASCVRDAPFYGFFYEIKSLHDVAIIVTTPDTDHENNRPSTPSLPSTPTVGATQSLESPARRSPRIGASKGSSAAGTKATQKSPKKGKCQSQKTPKSPTS